jgi:ABC-type Fe3+-hydroxamate transport system substrate-binding protein
MSLAPTDERDLTDAMGTVHEVAGATARIVSLVPSITELLFDLGLAGQIVGRTGFCVHPGDQVKRVANVGGTKTAELGRIKRLAPTHVIVNVDENPRAMVEELARFVPHVVVTHPLKPEDNVGLFRLLGRIFSRENAAQRLCDQFSIALQETLACAAAWPRRSVLYLIWKSPWMSVSRDTYVSRMLATVGWDTHVARSDARYPTVELDPALLDSLDLVLLSTEPYTFRERHCVEIIDQLPPGSHTRVALIDGAMTSWYGSRAIPGLRYLRELRAALG